jgi:predicted secreted Zn-dependent protease
MRILASTVFGLTLFLSSIAPSTAGPISRTVYNYYPVSGDTLAQVYRKMASAGPASNGTRGFGATTIHPGEDMSVASCRKHGTYPFSMKFVVQLPKLASSSRLSKSEHKLWVRFARFVKSHEENHRSIWLKEGARIEREFKAPGVLSCEAAKVRADKAWRKLLTSSASKHAAFDAAQANVLKIQPFVMLASR